MPSITEHNANLRKAGIPTVETLTRRVLDVFDRATKSDVEAGATWYDEQHELALDLASAAGSVEHAAAVISHLSPRTSWARNVAGAIALCRNGTKAMGIMAPNFERAAAALDADDPESTFNGPKTLRFYRNILGDTEAVTVDVWAARVVGVEPESQLSRKGVYDAVELAYQRAARRRGVEPRTMQATTWIVVRNGRAS